MNYNNLSTTLFNFFFTLELLQELLQKLKIDLRNHCISRVYYSTSPQEKEDEIIAFLEYKTLLHLKKPISWGSKEYLGT